MVKLYSFSQNWPHIVQTREDVPFDEILAWAHDRAEQLDAEPRDLYTSFALSTYGFRDKSMAMEFKLRFG